MPGLALAVTQLTVSQAQLLLAIPMERLRACPTLPVDAHDPRHLPAHPVAHQDDPGTCCLAAGPQDNDPHLVLDVWYPQGGCVLRLRQTNPAAAALRGRFRPFLRRTRKVGHAIEEPGEQILVRLP